VMEFHSADEIEDLARHLQQHDIDYVFAYTSYLKPDNQFNPTFDYAADFIAEFHKAAPEIKLLAWIGVPVQITTPEGEYVANRLADSAVRETIAGLSAKMVNDFKFDGIHLNTELMVTDDAALIETLEIVKTTLPENAFLSLATHALRPQEQVTSIPYPQVAHHWTEDYLTEVAGQVDQIVLMAYDSALFFPSDYRHWVYDQVKRSNHAVSGIDVNFLIGLPTSEEWTFTHNITTEYLANSLYGYRSALAEAKGQIEVDGIAIYPHWETDDDEWKLVDDWNQ
jgi:hypothetical protein